MSSSRLKVYSLVHNISLSTPLLAAYAHDEDERYESPIDECLHETSYPKKYGSPLDTALLANTADLNACVYDHNDSVWHNLESESELSYTPSSFIARKQALLHCTRTV